MTNHEVEDTHDQEAEKSPARKQLELLESTSQYLFHGSPVKIEEFEPRQATDGNPATGESWEDGPPGIAASEKADVAIFRALINRANVPEYISFSSGWNDEENNLNFHANHDAVNAIRKTQPAGYIYVFKREDFQPFRGHEWRRLEPIRPHTIVTVGFDDLPKNVDIQ